MCSVPDDFFDKLKEIYSSKPHLQDYWSSEEKTLREIIQRVSQDLAFNYELGLPFNVGGSGVVCHIHDKNLDSQRVLKIPRPSPGKQVLLARVLGSESQHLRRLSHENLIRIFAQGAVKFDEQDYPFYVMEYVEGRDSDEFFAQPGLTSDGVFRIFDGVLAAVSHLHSHDTIHMDLKPGNILVTQRCTPILSDLGFAKRLTIDGNYTLIGGTEGFIHPEARKLVEEIASDPNRLSGTARRTKFKRQWDLFSLGKTFLALLAILDEHNPKTLSAYNRRYLRLLACRLLDGYNDENERAVGLSLATFQQIKYLSVDQAREDLSKLAGKTDLLSRIPELNEYNEDVIQASIIATTSFTPRVRELLSHPVMMRLSRVSQLGLLYLEAIPKPV